MSKKGQGEKPSGGPPVPSPPGGPQVPLSATRPPVPAMPAMPGSPGAPRVHPLPSGPPMPTPPGGLRVPAPPDGRVPHSASAPPKPHSVSGPPVPIPQSRPEPTPPQSRPVPTPQSRPVPTPQSRPVPILQNRPLVITSPTGPPVLPSAGGQPKPLSPRKHRTSVPTTATPGELTASFVAPPPMVVKRRAEQPTASSKVARPGTPPLLSPVVTPPRKVIDPGSLPSGRTGVLDAGPFSSLKPIIPDDRPMSISSQVTPPRIVIIPGSLPFGTTGELHSGRVSSRRASMPDPVPMPISSHATQPTSDTTRASGAKATPRRVSILETHADSVPVDRPDSTPTKNVPVSKPSKPSPIKASDTVESLQTNTRNTRPSSSAQATQSTQVSKGQLTSSHTPRGSVKEERPSTSGEGNKTTPLNRQPRRASIGGSQNKAKTGRILYTTDEEVRDALIEFTVFIIFLILTSLVTLSVRHSYMFYFNDTIKKLFTTRDLVIAPSVTVCFDKQITVPDWWDYLIYNFLITLHGDLTLIDGRSDNDTTNNADGGSKPQPEDLRGNSLNEFSDDGASFENTVDQRARRNPGFYWDPGVDSKTSARSSRQKNPRGKETQKHNHNSSDNHLEGRVFLYENLLLGPPRIRQIRVRKESCYVNDAFIRYFNSCYAAYSRSAEDRSDFQGISYQTMSALHTMPLWTVLAFYRTGGYVVDLTYEKNENLAIITDLKNNHWLDRGSRLCLVEFNLFNDNTDIFQSVKLIAEIPPTGGVIPQAHLQTVKQHSFFTDRSMVMSVIYIFWYIMVVYYTIYEINEVRKSGCKNYIFSIMNMLDCIILLLCYLALGYNIWHSLKINSVTTRAMVDFTYQSLDVLCFWNIIYVDMMAILAFLVWIKIFKFISFNKTLVQFTTTLKRCSKDLAGFSLMFGIVFLAYAQLGLLLFGTKHPDFRNFITSILTMIRMILGDFQYNLIEQANRVLGPIYFLTYILLVFFILLNMFLAIIMETYNTVKGEITQGRSQLGSYIYKKTLSLLYWIIHCGRKRRPNREPTPETEEENKVTEEEPEVMQKNLTATEARYFQEIPPGENKDLVRLTNRVSLLEEILEKLITNMDDILKRVEQETAHRRK